MNFIDKKAKTLIEILDKRLEIDPTKTIYNFLENGETVSDSLIYRELVKIAQNLAAGLQKICKPGDRVLLLFPQGLDYVVSFFGCLYAGLIAVPAFPPNQNRNLQRIGAIVKNAKPTVALIPDSLEQRIKKIIAENTSFNEMKWLSFNSLQEEEADLKRVDISKDSIAFLQYTSGSTSTPKGVMVTHDNLVQNQEMIRRMFRQDSTSVILGWLPLYHDMGLIGNVLQPLYVNATCYLMSPTKFLQNPFLWLNAISKYGATTSGGPNFAYELCSRRINREKMSGLDLSKWKVAFNGAEPINSATLEIFAETFESTGFSPKSFVPCYGLAEATLLVSANNSETEKKTEKFDANELEKNKIVKSNIKEKSKILVNCGKLAEEIDVKIVNSETLKLAGDNEVGEIWLAGANIAKGYWENESATENDFNAKIVGGGETKYLRTGDLGFINENELFVTGRLKEIIIQRGRNLYSHDIEIAVEQVHPSLRKNFGMAIAVMAEDSEKLIIVHELEPRKINEYEGVFEEIKKVLSAEFEVVADEIILVKPGTLPKTSSGKKQRTACRKLYFENKLVVIDHYKFEKKVLEAENSEEIEILINNFDDFRESLRRSVAELLEVRVEEITDEKSLLSYGLDSLTALKLTHQLETKLNAKISSNIFLEEENFGSLCRNFWNLRETFQTKELFSTKSSNSKKELSERQKSLWFLQQLSPKNIAYNLNFVARIKSSDFDEQKFRKAFGKIVKKHENLRTTFYLEDGKPYRKIHDLQFFEWRNENVSEGSETKLKEIIKAELERPFDLVEEPLMRIVIWKTLASKLFFSISIHHIIADFWSLAIIVKELKEFYSSLEFIDGNETANKQSYDEFVFAEKQFLTSESGEKSLAFWDKHLAGELPYLNLPNDYQRPSTQTFNGQTFEFSLEKSLVAKLKNLSREKKVTLFVTLLTAYKTLLYRYTRQQDIIVGTPTAGRTDRKYKDSIGYFVNPIAIRSFPSERSSFSKFLQDVNFTVLEALKNQDYPFLLLVEKLNIKTEPSRSPIFQTMFMVQQSPLREYPELAVWNQREKPVSLDLDGLELESFKNEESFSQFDMTLLLTDYEGEMSGKIQYNSDIFASHTIERIGRNFGVLLNSIVANPEMNLTEFELLTNKEYETVIHKWNQTELVYDENKRVCNLFEEQAESNPQKIAVSCGDTNLSYSELNKKANKFANFLKAKGIRTEEKIGICLSRSDRLIPVLMGVLKVGAAYVPLDPNYPKLRLEFMLRDSESKFVVSENSLLEKIPKTDALIINLDDCEKEIAGFDDTDIELNITSNNLAYIIYTSGSTGQPKGVTITHQNISAFIAWASGVYSAEEIKKVLASTSICFDLSLFEIFFTLSQGGEVYLVENALSLVNNSDESGITLINTVPSAMTELCRLNRIPKTVKTINLAGEPLLTHLVNKVYENEQIEKLYNLYGPSEDTTYTTYALVSKTGQNNSLIGKPINNTQIYLLDENLAPVTIGSVGEIYIGGDGLARNYFNSPEITAEKFIPNSFSSKEGSRLYRTNDLAKFLYDGNLVYLGRSDYQVKIRGYRIELTEIETRLAEHSTVKEAVVVSKKDDSEKDHLIGYIVSEDGKIFVQEEINKYLKNTLPEYMIPSMYVVLESLPQTPNGKINRKALPKPIAHESKTITDFDTPTSFVEEIIVNQMSELLSKKIGVNQNFFENGGHSLLATQLMHRIEKSFQIKLPLQEIFEKATPYELSEFIEKILGTEKTAIDAISKIDKSKPHKLSYTQQRLWFIDQLQPDSSAYNIPVALHLRGELNLQALEYAFNRLLKTQYSLRTRFTEIDSQPVQIIQEYQPISIKIEKSEGIEKSELQDLINKESGKSFDLEEGRLLRVKLLDISEFQEGQKESEYVLIIVMHHIITDGWSMGVIVKELVQGYREYQEDKGNVKLTDTDVGRLQYVDYAEWQRKRFESADGKKQEDYWKEKLSGIETYAEITSDFQRPTKPTFEGEKIPFNVSKNIVDELRQVEISEGVTTFMICLVGLYILLNYYTQEKDICVGVPVANRPNSETENIIGFFVNTLVMRANLKNNPTIIELLEQVKRDSIQSFSHQSMPFEALIEKLSISRDVSRNPMFQVAFAFQNTPHHSLNLGNLEITFLETETKSSKFDLTIDLSETEKGLTGYFEYNTNIFKDSTIKDLSEKYIRILKEISLNPTKKISEVTILSKEEIEDLISTPNQNQTDYPRNKTIQECFRETVKKYSSSTALVFGKREITYEELNNESDKLANYFQEMDVEEGNKIAIAMTRSPELIISILAVIKAGCAYVPIDSSFPNERIEYILQDTGAKILLTNETTFKKYNNILNVKIVNVDFVLESNQLNEIKPQTNNPFAQQIAYIMYTSGSTGQPKGVCVTHRNILRLVKNPNYAKLDENEVILQYAPFSFDASTFEIWGALLNGGKMVLMPNELSNADNLSRLVKEHNITTLWLTAGLFHLMVDEELKALTNLKQLLAGGDVLSISHVNKFLEAAAETILINGYGPTENTTFSTCFRMEKPLNNFKSVPIGKSISNTQVYVVDENLRLVPKGVAGEILVGGDGVSLGYLNKPDLTAEKFIPNPFGHKNGERLYRTGDLGRFISDDTLEFISRKDNQIKIRGYRIEPGEIETILQTHPNVEKAVVIVENTVYGEKLLNGYVTEKKGTNVKTDEVKSYLTKKLPAYMIPSKIIVLDDFPITQNGKIDRKAISLLGESIETDEIQEPQTELEIQLAGVWKELFQREQIGINEDFFAIGGHSLLATRLASGIKKNLAVEVPIVKVFENPTIRLQAKYISENREHKPKARAITAVKRGSGRVDDLLEEIRLAKK